MRMMSLISALIFVYEALSLVLPLRLRGRWKFLIAALLLAAALRNELFQKIGGGMFFAPELPRWAMLTGALLYNFLIVALFLLLLKDAARLLWRLWPGRRPFPGAGASLAVLAAAALLTLYGTWEAVRVPDAVTRDLLVPGLPPEFEGARVAVIVDLHASALNRRPFVQAVVDRTNALSPDLILMPGDFVDGLLRDREQDIEPLGQLKAPLGVWGSSGNHEYYSGYEDWMGRLEGLGVAMLENRHAVLTSGDGRLVLAGVPDPQSGLFGFAPPDPDLALRSAPRGAPVILMAHRPQMAAESARAGATIQISGHTHGGQMPGLAQLIARFNAGYVRGWYDVGPMRLYVSPGASLWNGFPLRLFDPAEITLFILRGR